MPNSRLLSDALCTQLRRVHRAAKPGRWASRHTEGISRFTTLHPIIPHWLRLARQATNVKCLSVRPRRVRDQGKHAPRS